MIKYKALLTYNDNELLYLVKENSEEAIEILVEKYRFCIWNKIRDMNITIEAREDFLQEGLILLHKAIWSFVEEKNVTFYSYFHLLLTRKFIDLLRKQKREKRVVPLEMLEEYVIDTNSSEDYVEEGNVHLSTFEQIIFQMRFLEEKKPREIACDLMMPIRKIYDGIDRIKRKMKDEKEKKLNI
ncbi:MAG: sigma-70 family RNA polymerase sigma factor [Prevotella sp.]|nr:sigma-70 family RNA polymerase sigma factor [Staphylococcus sp.]MCM1350486.1 sigma-70 family RNA polymerase sigma factor [Prevotella sp.]